MRKKDINLSVLSCFPRLRISDATIATHAKIRYSVHYAYYCRYDRNGRIEKKTLGISLSIFRTHRIVW